MVFFGLQLMKNGFAPIKELPGFEEMFMKFQPDSYLGVWKCVMVGAILTAIVQSSSATLGITIALALTGAINFHTAAALILGENIGTTITAFLASLGAFTNAKRAAYAHVIFNVLGVCWITLLFTPYTNLISRVNTWAEIDNIPVIAVADASNETIREYAQKYEIEESLYFENTDGQKVNSRGYIYDQGIIYNQDKKVVKKNVSYVLPEDFIHHIERNDLTNLPSYTERGVEYPFTGSAIAFTHSGFNIANTLLFLPFVGLLSRFLMRLVPDKKIVERPHLTYLNVRMLDTPAIAIEQSYKELMKMSAMTREMLTELKPFLSNQKPEREAAESIFQQENDLDVIQKEVAEFIGEIMTGSIPHELMQEASGQLRIADELESISDYIQGLLKLRLKVQDTGQKFSEGGLKDLAGLHEKVDQYLALIAEGLEGSNGSPEYFSEMQTKGLAVTNLMKECRTRHLMRVGKAEVNPLMSLIYTDMLTAYRRIKDHAFNIAEVLIGEK
jgi:Na+/phosphate symporter